MILEIRLSTGERIAELGETVKLLRVRIDDAPLAREFFSVISDMLRIDAQEFVYSHGDPPHI